MNLLDTRTVLISYVISNAVCAIVMTFLWRQNRKRFVGLGLWLADYIMQFVALLLVALRGIVPDWVSIVVGNALVIGGTILLYMGLQRFVGRRGMQIHNVILLAAFIFVQTYFAFVQPNLTARSINLALGLIAICSQCAWLLLRRVEVDMRPITRGAGAVFVGYCVINLARIAADLAVSSGNDLFHLDIYDTLTIMTYQMLFIVLTFGLFLMVNRRLVANLERDIAERQRADEALKLSEEKFYKAFQASPDAILITRNSDGQFIEVNEGFCRLTGYSREEALTSSTVTLGVWANPQDRDRALASLRENHSVRDQEYDFRTKSGKIMNGLFSGEIIYLGDEAHVLSVVRDITERVRTEEVRQQTEAALRQSEADFREVFDNTAQGIFIIDVLQDGNFRIGNSNKAEEIATTIRRDDVQGKLLEEAFPPEIAQAVHANYSRCIAAGAPIAYEEEINLPAGRRFYHTALAPVRDESGRFYRIIGSTLDMTESKRVEELIQLRLRLLEFATTHSVGELMQKALDEIGEITNSPIGFYHFVGVDQKTLSLQAWSTRTLNEFCQAEGQGMHYDIDQAGVWVDCVYQRKPVIHNDYAALPHRKGLPAGHAQVIRELVAPTLRDGRVVSILGVGNKPSDYGEQDAEFVSYIADVVWTIVERKRMEDDLRQAKEIAEAANRAKSVFLANMSHELRTPLNAILGFSDLMARDRSLSAEQQENLAIVKRSGEHLLSLINGVLDMAKIESGRMLLQEHAFDVQALLNSLTEMFRQRATDKGLTLIIEGVRDVPRYIVADEGKLRQILINLLGNAVKFTEAGGIGLRAQISEVSSEPKYHTISEVCNLHFEVQDTGSGIAPSDLEAVFDPFVQSASGQKSQEGTGLGLPISRQFARLMGGDLTASSEGIAGLGAFFKLDIPVRLAAPADLMELEKPIESEVIGLQTDQYAADGGPYRLLVAEDRAENRQLLVKLLTHWGFEVRAAVNGLEAVNLWQEWQPHLIWMDLRMPVMDGHEASHRIKSVSQATIIIALTASAFEDERERVLVEGCDDFVRKPFREYEIADMLVKHLGVRFVYAGTVSKQTESPQPAALDLTGLPAGWVADLRQAALEADVEKILQVVDAVRGEHPTLALALAEAARNFGYQSIISAALKSGV